MIKQAMFVMAFVSAACVGTDPEDAQSVVEEIVTPTCATAMAGLYCGNDGVTNGDPRTLYRCSRGVATTDRVCGVSCEIRPPGQNDRCAPWPISVTTANSAVLSRGNYDASGNLRWADGGSSPNVTSGGSRLSVVAGGSRMQAGLLTRVDYGADPAGNCVPFVKATSGRTDGTATWVRGVRAIDNCATVPVGTAVATFTAGGVYSGHVGYVAACNSATSTLTLWDENYITSLRVGRHDLRRTNVGGVSDAASYFVVIAR